MLTDPLTTEGAEIVVLAKVLADDINFGYQDMGGVQLEKINGTLVESMVHFAQLLADVASGGEAYYELELANSQLLVLDVEACATLEAAILEVYGLSDPCSADLGLL